MDGSKVDIFLQPSNLQIIELNLDDKKRLDKLNKEIKKETTKTKEVKRDESKNKIKEKKK